VIGLPGETVEINMNGEVKIDGVTLDEPYVYETFENSLYKPVKVTVPEGEVFVMGDHRDDSTDSRDPRVGTIDIDAILGKVLIRFYPFKDGKFGKIE
jgi:signal peptidase I